MEYIVGAIILSGCAIGGSILANGILADIYRQKKLAAYRADKRREEERALWRGVDQDIRKRNSELCLENERLKHQIRSMKELMANIRLKDIEESW